MSKWPGLCVAFCCGSVFVIMAVGVTFVSFGSVSSTEVLNSVSAPINLLQIYIVVASLGLSILGFFGYQRIKESAAELANKMAKDTAEKYMKNNIEGITNTTVQQVLPTVLTETKKAFTTAKEVKDMLDDKKEEST